MRRIAPKIPTKTKPPSHWAAKRAGPYTLTSEAGKPVRTNKLMEFIAQHRPLSGDDPAKAKIVIQSSLNKDKRFKSVPWEGKRAWWYADRPIPKKESNFEGHTGDGGRRHV